MLGTALFGEAGLNAEAVTSDGTNKDMLALTSGDVVCAIGNASACQQFIEEGTAVPIVVFSADAYEAVSYTHLDVYKRQVQIKSERGE